MFRAYQFLLSSESIYCCEIEELGPQFSRIKNELEDFAAGSLCLVIAQRDNRLV